MSEILAEPTIIGDQGSTSDTILRKRNPWNSLVSDSIDLLDDVDELDDEEEEDGVGCPLPSTPEDNQLLEAEVILLFTWTTAVIFVCGEIRGLFQHSKCNISSQCHIKINN